MSEKLETAKTVTDSQELEIGKFKIKYQGREFDILVRDPKPSDIREADKARSRAHKEAFLVEKLPLAITAREEAINRGLWNEDKQRKLLDAQTELIRCENLINKDRDLKLGGPGNTDENTMFRIALKCQDLRDQIINLRTIFAEVEKDTVERYSEDERFNYLLYATTVYKDSDKRFFDSFDDFKNAVVFTEENKEKCGVANLAYMHYQMKLIGNYDKSLDDTPDKKFLKRFKFIDEKGRFLNKEGRLVNLGGELVDEVGVAESDKKPVEPPKPFLDDEGQPIIDDAYKAELDAFNEANGIKPEPETPKTVEQDNKIESTA